VSRLILVLGDQLTEHVAALKAADKAADVVVMAEVAEEGSYVPHHPKKIALILSAMRKFAARLRTDGWTVAYSKLDDADNSQSIAGELLRRAAQNGTSEVIATRPGEFRLIAALEDCPLQVVLLEDDRFIASHKEFEDWAEGRKALRMEYFYREMRRKTGLLMEGNQPAGGKWNYDHDNRKPAPDDVAFSGPLQFTPDAVVEEVLDLVERRFGSHFGDLRPFWFATDAEQVQHAMTHFVTYALPRFGDFQDAMLNDNRFLYHSLISFYLNAGLLDPLDVCQQVEAAYRAGLAPLNAVEGFIRQIIGWREYVRGLYWYKMPAYKETNFLNAQRSLPDFYWTGETDMACVAEAIEHTRKYAYSHHIQRLMVTGNFALLAGIHPDEINEWYLVAYHDAYEWVELPNTHGMAIFADGGIMASKPYAASANYINKMSDFCSNCAFDHKAKTGEKACPFNYLYWDFLARNEEKLRGNPRMGLTFKNLDEKAPGELEAMRAQAEAFLIEIGATPRQS